MFQNLIFFYKIHVYKFLSIEKILKHDEFANVIYSVTDKANFDEYTTVFSDKVCFGERVM